MKSIFIYDRSCETRKLESYKIHNYFKINGYDIVRNPKNSDIIIFMACAVTNNQAESSLAKVKEFKKYKKELIIVGCLPAIDKKKLDEIFNGKTISTKDLFDFDKYFPDNKINFKDVDESNNLYQNLNDYNVVGKLKGYFYKIRPLRRLYNTIFEHILTNFYGENSYIFRFIPKRNTFYIKISTGCLGACSYCAIKKAIGPLRSKTFDECIKEFKKGLNAGYKNFIITGDDTGAYGLDIKNKNFAELLKELSNYPGSYKIAIRNFHPKWIVKYINELESILKNKKIFYIESAIQSGNEHILRLMKRYSNTKEIKNAYIRLRKSYPEIILSTDCIIGFPSETKKEFKDTLNFLNDSGFNSGSIISYSRRNETEAEKIEPKISKDEIKNRLKYSKKFLTNSGYTILNKSNIKKYINFEKLETRKSN